MLLTEENIDIWYREYLKQFKTTTKYVKSRKGQIRSDTPLSRRDFKIDFISETYDNPKLGGKQIARKMAKQEIYVASSKEAVRFAEAHARTFGGEVSFDLIMKYRTGALDDLWEAISETRAELKKQGYTTYQANIIVSQEFFGS